MSPVNRKTIDNPPSYEVSEHEATITRQIKRIFFGVVALIVFFIVIGAASSAVENVGANEIAVIQSRWSGTLYFYTQPGVVCQCFGKLTVYPKRWTYTDEQTVRFNDGGHGTMKGLSVQVEMPLDATHLKALHTNFGSQEAIDKSLITPSVVKSVYMTGPLMSSKESYAEKRNYLISYVEDQIAHGVYKTTQQEVRQEDPLTKAEKTVVVVNIVQANGVPARQEASSLERFGVLTSNFSFKTLEYDATVEAQIQGQQKIAMDVQTAIANARKAEQDALTIEQRGKADAAQAKWEQEVQKAKAVTQAEQEKAVALTIAEKDRGVAELKVKTADLYKQEQTLRGEADATYRRKVLEADGALSAKLATYEKVNGMWSEAFKQHTGQLVPGVIMGSGGGTGNALNSTQNIMDIIAVKMANDLGLDMKPSPAHVKKP